ncbi:MAG: hypothetical protein Q8L88_02215 [Bacteroidota bacterium]|nr:hypothetical protein [Bacteroidota bacterium]
MKPIFICDRIDLATLTASAGSDASYPLTNLKDGRYATQWKSGATTQNQTLTITHQSIMSPDCILIVNHNFNTLGLTSLELQNDAGSLKTIASFPSVIFETISTFNESFLLLKFNKGSALSAIPAVGMIFIGSQVELPGIINNPKKGFATVTDLDESLSALTFATQVTDGKYTRKFTLDGLTSAEETDFIRLLNTISNRLHPFFLRDTDGNWNFVRLGQDAVDWSQWSKVKSFPQELLFVGELPGVQFIV